MGRLNELVGADFTTSWGFERDHDRTSLVDVARSSSYVSISYFDTLSEGLRTGDMGFLFSLRVPEPAQRNRPVMIGAHMARSVPRGFAKRMGLTPQAVASLQRGYAATMEHMERHGVAHHTQLRTVICDGALAIGYLNVILPHTFSARQRRLYALAAEALRRRLVLGRRLAMVTAVKASLDVALEALGRAAFVIDPAGAVLHANTLGELALQTDRALPATFSQLLHGRTTDFELVPIDVAGLRKAYLVMKRTADLAELASGIATELGLGDRGRAVFVLAASGEPTKAIATRLDLAENTIEYHLGVIFRRLGVASRGELYQLLLERALRGRR